jgi:hypothetical protein
VHRNGLKLQGRRRQKPGALVSRSPLTALLVAFSLIVQLFAAAAPPAVGAAPYSGADDAAVAAELKALFGDTAALCVHDDGAGGPVKHAPGHCCDQCPLCRSLSQAVACVPPDAPALPKRANGDAHAIRAPPGNDALPSYPAQPNPARAPPLDV